MNGILLLVAIIYFKPERADYITCILHDDGDFLFQKRRDLGGVLILFVNCHGIRFSAVLQYELEREVCAYQLAELA